MIIIIMLTTYVISCLLTFKAFVMLSASSPNPNPRVIGIRYLIAGTLIRLVTIIFAWSQGLFILYAIIGQLLPYIIMAVFCLVLNVVDKFKE